MTGWLEARRQFAPDLFLSSIDKLVCELRDLARQHPQLGLGKLELRQIARGELSNQKRLHAILGLLQRIAGELLAEPELVESENSGVRDCERRRKSVFADYYLSKLGRGKIPVQVFYIRRFEIGLVANHSWLFLPGRLGHREDEIDHEAAIVHGTEVLFFHDGE